MILHANDSELFKHVTDTDTNDSLLIQYHEDQINHLINRRLVEQNFIKCKVVDYVNHTLTDIKHQEINVEKQT
jgi:hypothetical protein